MGKAQTHLFIRPCVGQAYLAVLLDVREACTEGQEREQALLRGDKARSSLSERTVKQMSEVFDRNRVGLAVVESWRSAQEAALEPSSTTH